MGLPIAHIAGGDVTEGAYDDSFRHGISKAASLHFATNEDAKRRLRQMGEPEDRIYMVGSPGLDPLETMDWMQCHEVFEKIGISAGRHNVLVTYHPVTRLPEATRREVAALCEAIKKLPEDSGVVITGTNIDTQAEEVRTQLEALAHERPNTIMRESLGHTLYLNAVKVFDAVVGNSSSGLYEAPALKTPTVNIGDRQKGRPKAASVIDVEGDAGEILQAMQQAFSGDFTTAKSPYGNGGAGQKIVSTLESIKNPGDLVLKPFSDVKFSSE
jgi:UDP-N-acetylglucosamine 2-epimerase (non-hydrolysing)/GDP/UDP-N,N'-diacetylbacillosamine 2-epimerase (hydrolysing)